MGREKGMGNCLEYGLEVLRESSTPSADPVVHPLRSVPQDRAFKTFNNLRTLFASC